MSEYERSAVVSAPADRVFSFVSNPENMPRFLPTLQNAEFEPGGKLHIRGKGDNYTYDTEGYFRTDQGRRRMEWGAETARSYNGWLQVDPDGGNSSRITVHLSFSPQNETADKIQQQTGDRDASIGETMDKTLEQIRKLVES